MNKKIVCTLMVGTLLAGMLTGCGGSSEGGSSAKGSKGTELELFSTKAENKDILQKLVDKFNEKHEDVTIRCRNCIENQNGEERYAGHCCNGR